MKGLLITCFTICTIGTAFADEVDIPNQFSAGTPAVAAQVNANFGAVESAVDDNAMRVVALEAVLTNGNPFDDIQTQLDALTVQIQNLQDAAPDSSVEDRTYCFVLDLTIMRGWSADGSEELQHNIIRRTATFSGGTLNATLLSNVLNNQQDDGIVIAGLGDPFELSATYLQSGAKLDITFSNGSTANWYVSKDGSLIHGSTILHGVFAPGGVVTIGFVHNWTLVENDTCDLEGQ